MSRGLRATGLGQFAQLALQLLSVAILARLLTPHAFGLVAMVMVVIGVAELFRDMGLSNAALQARHVSIGLRSNLFWVNTGIGAALMGLVALSSPLIAALYNHDELVAITIALSPTFLVSGMATQYRVHLMRELRFKALASIGLFSALVSLIVAIVAATLGMEVWAIVAQSLTSAAVTLVLLAFASGWLPKRPAAGTGIRAMAGLGTTFMASSLLTYVRLNADSFIIGNRFGSETLGLYNRSLQLVRNPIRQLQAPFGSVVLPVAARRRDDDIALMATLREFQPLLGYAVCGLAAVVVAAPRDVVLLVLGSQWLDAAPVMAIAATSAAVAAAASPVSWLYTARGMGGALLGYTTFTTVLTVALIVGGAQLGFIGAATGYLVAGLISFPITFWRAQSLTGLPMRRLGVQCARPVVLLGLVWASSRGIAAMWHIPFPGEFGLAAGLMALIAALSLCLPAYRADYTQILRTLRSLR